MRRLWQTRLGPWEDKDEFQGTQAACSSRRRRHDLEAPHVRPAGEPVADQHCDRTEPRHCACMPRWAPTTGDYSSAAGLGVFRSDDAAKLDPHSPPTPGLRCRIAAAICRGTASDPSNPDVVYTAAS